MSSYIVWTLRKSFLSVVVVIKLFELPINWASYKSHRSISVITWSRKPHGSLVRWSSCTMVICDPNLLCSPALWMSMDCGEPRSSIIPMTTWFGVINTDVYLQADWGLVFLERFENVDSWMNCYWLRASWFELNFQWLSTPRTPWWFWFHFLCCIFSSFLCLCLSSCE